MQAECFDFAYTMRLEDAEFRYARDANLGFIFCNVP